MQNESKQNLISLSLAGSIGYYLYSKLIDNKLSIKLENKELNSEEEKITFNNDIAIDESPNENQEQKELRPEEIAIEQEKELKSETVQDEFQHQLEEAYKQLDDSVESSSTADIENDETLDLNQTIDNQDFSEDSLDSDQEEQLGELDLLGPLSDQEEVAETTSMNLLDEQEENNNTPEQSLESELESSLSDLDVLSLDNKDDDTKVDDIFDAIEEKETPKGEDENILFDNGTFESAELLKDVQNEQRVELPDLSFSDLLAEGSSQISKDKGEENDLSLDDLLEQGNDSNATSLVEDDLNKENSENAQQPSDLMKNTEALHKIDSKDENAKAEYKSIMDFFNSL